MDGGFAVGKESRLALCWQADNGFGRTCEPHLRLQSKHKYSSNTPFRAKQKGHRFAKDGYIFLAKNDLRPAPGVRAPRWLWTCLRTISLQARRMARGNIHPSQNKTKRTPNWCPLVLAEHFVFNLKQHRALYTFNFITIFHCDIYSVRILIKYRF